MTITTRPKCTVIGVDVDTNEQVVIGDTYAPRGIYLIGGTGSGKTTLIHSMILQNIRQGKGVGVIDPHADLIRDIIACLPEERLKDVIYLNVSDEKHIFGLNLFTCNDLKSYKATQEVVDLVRHIFERALGVSNDTPLILDYLQQCTHVLLANRGYTMADISLFFIDKQFRQHLLKNVTNEEVLSFWKKYEDLRSWEQQAQADSVLRRIRQFLQPLARNIVGQSFSTIDFFAAMEERKIILISLDGELESVTSLIGSTLISLFLMASYRRRGIDDDKRKYFGLFCDEFQTYATADFSKILTELRKYNIATSISHQARNQPGMTEGLRATTTQVGNLIIFHVSGDDAESLAKEFAPRPDPADVRQIEVQTPISDVLGHLQRRGSHDNPIVNDFLHTYQLLGKAEYNFLFSKANRGVPFDQLIQTEEEKERLLQLVQTEFFQAAKEKLLIMPTNLKLQSDRGFTYPAYYKGNTPSEQEVLQLVYFYLFIPNNRYILQDDRHSFPSEQVQRQKEQQSLLTTLLHFAGDPLGEEFKDASRKLEAMARERFSLIRGTREVNRLIEANKPLVEHFILDLHQVLWIIRNKQITAGNGTYEFVPGPVKPITSYLVGLRDHHAHVKISTPQGRKEHTIRTYKPEKGLERDDLKARIAWIIENNLEQGYLRNVAEVEEEIRKRQESWREQSSKKEESSEDTKMQKKDDYSFSPKQRF